MEIRLGTITISDTDEQTIFFGDFLDQEKLDNFHNNVSSLERFKLHSELYSIFIINFVELSQFFQDTVDNLTKKQIQSLRSNIPEFRMINRNANRLLFNLLSSGRTLIDHQETYLKKRYGKDSEEVSQYKKVTNEVYDSSFEYRFIYKLRNYAQHCGFPIGHFEFEAKNKRDGDRLDINTRLNPLFKRDELLHNFDAWGQRVKEDLKNQPKEFPVMWTVGEYYKSVGIINEEFEKIELKEMLKPIEELKELLSKFENITENMEPCVFYDFEYSIPNTYENSKFTHQPIPLDLITEIESRFKN